MKHLYIFTFLIFTLSSVCSGQVPRLFNTQFINQSGTAGVADYVTGYDFEAAAFGSHRLITSVGANGDAFFRFRNGANTQDRRPNADGDIVPLNSSSPYTAIFDGAFFAFKFNATNGYRYVFKVNNAVTQLAVFEIQGTNIETVTSVTRNPSGTVFPGLDVTITANLSANFSAGQAAYLRYSNDGFATSTVVKMTGTGTSRTAIIPGVDNIPNGTLQYYVFTSGDVTSIAPGDADLFTINANNNGGSNYSYTVAAGWTTNAAGNWSNGGSKWTAGVAPPTGVDLGTVTINHTTTLNQNALVSAIVLNTATANILTLGALQTLEIRPGGSITRSSTATLSANASSTVRFLGSGTIGWANTWGNLEVGGGLTPTGAQTITTSFRINAGGFINSAPTYGTGSALIYNTGGAYGVGNEWTEATDGAAGLGRPNDVTITGNTTLNMPAANRSMARNLLIGPGSTLNLNNTSGDLLIRGNWTNNGTFNPNNRAVVFTGNINSQITRTGGETFNYLVVNKTADNVVLNNDVTVNAASGNVLQLLGGATSAIIGAIDLNGNNLTLSGAGGNVFLGTHTAATTRNIIGAGEFRITGAKTITNISNTTLVIDAASTIAYSASLDCGTTNLLTVNGNIRVDAGGFISNNSPRYGAASTLIYNTGGSYGVNAEWTATADGLAGVGLPANVTIQNGTTLNMPINFRAMAGNLTIQNGTTFNLNSSAGDFSLRGNWINNGGTFNHNNRFVAFRGNTTTTVQKSGGETFYQIAVNKTAAVNLQLLSDVTLTANTGSVLQLINTVSGGGIDLNGFNLTLNNNGGSIDVGPGNLVRNISGTGNLIINGDKSVIRSATSTLAIAAGVNIELNAALTLTAAFTTINGTLTMNAGSSVVTASPTYGAASAVIYNQGGTVNTGLEWTITTGGAAGAGRPADVTIKSGTTLQLTASRGHARDLLIESGAGLTLVVPNGAIIVGRNWTRQTGATFTHNNMLTTLGAVNVASSINAPGTETFGGLTISKTAATTYVDLNCDLIVQNAFTMMANAGRLKLNNNNVTFNGNITTTATSGTISSNGPANITINGSGASATLAFASNVSENTIGSLTINRTGPGTVNLASDLIINNGSGLNNSQLTLTTGFLQVNTGFTLTVHNTSASGSANSFVFTQTTGRMAYAVTGAGTYNLSFPIGSAANATSFRPLVLNNVVQTATNTYSTASTAEPGTNVTSSYISPIVGVSSVRYYPFNFGNLANITSVGSITLTVGNDEASTIDVQRVAQAYGGSWNDIGSLNGTGIKTSTLPIDLSNAGTHFILGFNSFPVIYFGTGGNDANSGESNTLRKLTLPAAVSAVANGGTIIHAVAGASYALPYNLDKNINFTHSGSGTLTLSGTPTITAKAVHPFTPANVNTVTDEITVTAHGLATGMPVTYNNYGQAFGFMPTDINVTTDVLTIGGNIPTGQPVIYQAYPSSGAAGGLTHGTTYFAINVSATQIRLATSYANALSLIAIDITSTGTAQSHGVIASTIQGLTSGSTYFAIVVDANTIKLAGTNSNALIGVNIDLLTAGGGNHVVYFTPTYTGSIAGAATVNVNHPQVHISGILPLSSNSTPTINVAAGNYFMQPTISLTKPLNIVGAGMGSTIFDGGGKISSATNYFGISYPTVAVTACTLSNFTVQRYYTGIYRNSINTNTSNVIEAVESSDNFNRGISWEGSGAIATALTIRNGIFNNNNGVGVYSAGIFINGMAKVGLNIRNNTCNGNRNAGIEIGPIGAVTNFFIRGNTVSGVNSVSPLHNSITEFGIVVTNAAPTGANTNISDNAISMLGRAAIECRGCVGNTNVTGNGSFRITGNYISQAGGPFQSGPNTSTQNEVRDIAGIAVGSMEGSPVSSGIAIDTNQIENLQQPFSATNAYTAFGIVAAGANQVIRANIVTGCEIGIQAQQGAPSNDNNTPDNFYSRDNTAATSGFEANRNAIVGNTDFGARNQGVAGTLNFLGNWWGDPTGPTHPANISPAGSGELLPTGTGIAYNGYMSVAPDDVPGTASGQRGIQVLSAKKFRLKPTANATSLATPFILQQGVLVVFNGNYTDTVDVYQATYNIDTTTVNLNRRVYMRGNFGNVANRPIVNGTGNIFPGGTGGDASTSNTSIFYVTVRNCGIENFIINVNPFLGSGSRIGILTNTANGSFSRLRIKNNVIQNTGTYVFGSWGIYLGNNSGGAYGDTVYLEGNRVSNQTLGVTNNSTFGRAVRAWYCNIQATGNILVSLYSIQHGNPRGAIGNNINQNILCGNFEINGLLTGSYTITNNSLRADSVGSFKAHAAIVEIRDNRVSGGLPILIQNNHFRNMGAGGGALGAYGIYSTMANNVTVLNNTFTPNPTTSFFVHIHVNTKHQANAPLTAFANGIDIRGNTFKGNSVNSANKYGIVIGNHNDTGDFTGGITIGSILEPNTFKTELSNYIYLCGLNGFSNGVPQPPFNAGITPVTPTSPVTQNIDARFNIYGVSGLDKAPGSMNLTELFELEDKINHKIDFASLGFVTIKDENVYVTNNSFFPTYTTSKLIQRGVDHAGEDWTVNIESGTYNETVSVTKSLEFSNNGATNIQNLTMNGTGRTLTLNNDFNITNTLTLTDGIINTGTNTLSVSNTAAGAIVGGSNPAHVVGRLSRAVVTGVDYDFPVGPSATLQRATMNFTNVIGLTDVAVAFTNASPGGSITQFNEANVQFDNILQDGYWIIEPNPGGNSTNYALRLYPQGFSNYNLPFPKSYTILKRVGANPWGQNGTLEIPPSPPNNKIFGDGSVRRINLSGFSNFGIGSGDENTLPIIVAEFNAKREQRSAVMNWLTTLEKDVEYFELQRSTDGIEFTTIARVLPNNTGSMTNAYDYTDANVFSVTGQAFYYRMRVYENGHITFVSPVRILSFDDVAEPAITLQPNPARDVITLSTTFFVVKKVIITDVSGKVVYRDDAYSGKPIKIATLPQGVYFVNAMGEQAIKKLKLVKE
jgi:hypothetical protein